MRRAAKVDANHGEVVAALRAYGCKVADLSGVGNGVPDILVWIPAFRRWILLEIKDGAKPPSARKLTEDQVKWHAEFKGCMVYVVTSAEEAIAAVKHFEG
jgi:hypothetical protein